jgi:hypothetical protein
VTFQPRYLMWVCEYGPDAEECKSQCIRNGKYCCPDPDDNLHEGYSGAQVLMVRDAGDGACVRACACVSAVLVAALCVADTCHCSC